MQFPACFRLASQLCAIAALVSSSSPTLREAANSTGILVGTAVRPYALSEPAYTETLAREFNMVEPEDALKWWVVRKTQDFDFREGDAVVRFAQSHAMKVRGHCLVWDHTNPDWLVQGHFTSEQMSRLLREHITTVMKHYAGQVFAWDVVNEALDENGRVKDSPWYNLPGIGFAGQGPAYIEQAFRWAREADPHALLFYNEGGGAETLNRKSDTMYAMVRDFKQRGVPIDGVGLQMHISNLDADTFAIAANIARLTALGLQVHITELDVSLPVDSGGQAGKMNLLRQAEVYRGVVRACLRNRGCTAIQTWGFTDKYSWIGSHSHGTQGSALLFDPSYKPKPAYDAVRDELSPQGKLIP